MLVLLIFLFTGALIAPMTQATHLIKESKTVETSCATIYYERYTMPDSQGKIPLVALHGGPGGSFNYLLALKELATERPVILYNQSGSEKSPIKNSDFSGWNLDYYTNELNELLSLWGYKQVYLLGHSWGAMLAVNYALKFPEKIEKLILAGPCLGTAQWENDCKKLAYSLSPEIHDTIIQHEATGTTDSSEYQSAVEKFYDAFYCRIKPKPDNLAASSINRTIYRAMWGDYETSCQGNLKKVDLIPELHKLTMPVLVITGEYDFAMPATCKLYTEQIPNARLAIVSEGAHMFPAEQPEQFIGEIDNFCNKSRGML